MSLVKSAKLANGVEIPMVAMGCAFGNWTGGTKFQGFLPEQAWRAVTVAFDQGMRHFDGAHAYSTERQVGDILGRKFASGELRREDVFLTTKLCNPAAPPHVAISHRRTWNPRDVTSVKDRILDDFDISLEQMGVGYFDLLLMHWPGAFDERDAKFARKTRAEIWAVFEFLLEKGTARAIGVSNFSKKHLEELFEDCKVKPMVNQIEFSPYCQDLELLRFCQSHDIVVEAYAPFGSGSTGVLSDPKIAEIAEKNGKGVGQVILRWMVQQGIVVLPKSSNPDRILQNLSLFDWELDDLDMEIITGLQPEGVECKRSCPAPASIV